MGGHVVEDGAGGGEVVERCMVCVAVVGFVAAEESVEKSAVGIGVGFDADSLHVVEDGGNGGLLGFGGGVGLEGAGGVAEVAVEEDAEGDDVGFARVGFHRGEDLGDG